MYIKKHGFGQCVTLFLIGIGTRALPFYYGMHDIYPYASIEVLIINSLFFFENYIIRALIVCFYFSVNEIFLEH